MASERILRPGRDISPVETHRAGRRRHHADELTGQRRLAGAGGADHAEHFAGIDPERDAAQDRLVAALRCKGQCLDREAPRRARQGQVRIAYRRGGEQIMNALVGAARRDHVAPGADHLLDRLQGTAEQDARREHRADCCEALDHQIGAEPENDGLHRQAQKLDDALHRGGAVACVDLPLEHPVAVAPPALQQAAHHAHRLHHLPVAQAHLGEGVVSRRRLVRLGQRRADQPLVDQRHHDQDGGREKGKKRRGSDAARR